MLSTFLWCCMCTIFDPSRTGAHGNPKVSDCRTFLHEHLAPCQDNRVEALALMDEEKHGEEHGREGGKAAGKGRSRARPH
jgi:hypothetical protein